MRTRAIVMCLTRVTPATRIASCAKPGAQWKDSAYPGKAEGVHGDIQLTDGGRAKIAKIELTKQNEAVGISDMDFERVPKEIIKPRPQRETP